jgi:hypothetical protein
MVGIRRIGWGIGWLRLVLKELGQQKRLGIVAPDGVIPVRLMVRELSDKQAHREGQSLAFTIWPTIDAAQAQFTQHFHTRRTPDFMICGQETLAEVSQAFLKIPMGLRNYYLAMPILCDPLGLLSAPFKLLKEEKLRCGFSKPTHLQGHAHQAGEGMACFAEDTGMLRLIAFSTADELRQSPSWTAAELCQSPSWVARTAPQAGSAAQGKGRWG